MIIAFPEGYELSPGAQTTRIYELERALATVAFSLSKAREALTAETIADMRPMVARYFVTSALLSIESTL